MAKIYISSTYSDLKDFREEAYRALRKLQHDVIAMEDYTAADQRPLDKCLADVAACDVYIGIFAWRYGFIPPDQKKSITELEFRTAQDGKKSCLLFLLDDNAPWSRALMDKEADKIEALREEIKKNFLVEFFSNKDELASNIAIAVSKTLASQPDIKIDVLSEVKSLFNAILTEKNKSQDYRRMLLTNFIDPIYNQLEMVHKQYLESFQNYRTLIKTTEQPLNLEHPIFELMQKDHALSDADRAKLVAMSEHLNNFSSDVGKKIASEPVGRLAQMVIDYIMMPAHELTQRWGLNAPRRSLLLELEFLCKSDLNEAKKKKLVIDMLDKGSERLQKHYMAITREYMKLKANLLT